MTSRIGVTLVALCGAIALVVLARTAAYYAHVDGLALALVLTMAVVLVGSIAELLRRVTRAEQLTRELAALPRPATLASVEGASDALRPILASRIANGAGPLTSAPLAGYAVGLLVMLGLLGTFLGLFETLRGAREALTSSGDVETLRSSLAAPMQGLTRSFGTSAAGVSASAMLGLAAALARAIEARFAQALSSYAAGALVPLTVQGRQLEALERLARHGDALPRAVVALDAAAARLGSLEVSWSEAHAKASQQTASALREAIVSVKSEIEGGVLQSVSAAEQALVPLLARAVEGNVAATREHVAAVAAGISGDLEARRLADAAFARARDEALTRMAASEDARAQKLATLWAETTRTLEASFAATEARAEARDAAFAKAGDQLTAGVAKSLSGDLEARRAADIAYASARDEALARLTASEDTRAQKLATLWAETTRTLEATFAATEARAEARDAAFAKAGAQLSEGVAKSLSGDLEARRLADVAYAHARDEALSRLTATEDARTQKLAALWTETTRTLEATFAANETRAEARDAAFAKAGAQLTEVASETLESARERMAEVGARASAQATQLGALVTAIEARSEAATAAALEQGAAVDSLLTGVAERADALDGHTRAGHTLLVAEMQRGALEHATRATALEREVGAQLAAQAERMMASMEAHTDALETRFDEVATAVRDAAAGVQAGGGELVAVAEMFAGAVDRHREGAAEWLAGLGTIEGAIARAAGESAGGALAEQLERARELYDAQLQFHRELLRQLRSLQITADTRPRERERGEREKDEDAPA